MVTGAVGALIVAIGLGTIRNRKTEVEEVRHDGWHGQETSGPTMGVVVAYAYRRFGLLLIFLGVLSAM